MMGTGERLPEAEQYIMECFWRHGEMTSAQLNTHVGERGWKPTTLLTFLSRLVKKRMLAVEKQGKTNRYRPLVGREAYRSQLAGAFLDENYSGDTVAFLASMADARGLSKAELAALRLWLQTQQEDEND
ncbi:BlaI/MecI/CopY family transcriptional regulator [Ruminococcaceae bacterium OttesenSCG-928-I18]|nr:BlaI/MecI/CopY family transcriptional regulator [Ruminococcaceae bacterium OttesenSCG-928-I18]